MLGLGRSLEVPILPLEEVRVSTALLLTLVEMALEFMELREELRLENVKISKDSQ